MITSDDLVKLVIRRVIFHDVPRNPKHGPAEPIMMDEETEVDPPRRGLLKAKLTRVIGSKRACPVCFDPDSSSPVPGHVRSYTRQHHGQGQFIPMSQNVARHLFEHQHGGISSGLLCAIDVVSGGLAGLVLMKLEREEGARLELTEREGKKAFAMSVLDNLVLTDGTRLFKTAMFLRAGIGEDDFRAAVCDTQLNVSASEDMARFWLRFLGCTFTVEPRVITQRFYDSALGFINDEVTNPVHKNDLYEHLHSQIKTERKTFSPKAFIEEYVPEEYQEPFRERLRSDKVPLTNFAKDLADIDSRLRHRAYLTTHGVKVDVPAESAEVVDVQPEQIIVNDTLLHVDRK